LNLSEILTKYSKFWQNLLFQPFDKNENIGEHSICNFSTNFYGGGRKIAKEGDEILPKVSPNV